MTTVRRLTVILEEDTRTENATPIIEAIQMIKGVGHVEPHVVDSGERSARRTALLELRTLLSDFVNNLWKIG